MRSLLDPAKMLRRMEIHVEEEVCAKRLLRGSFAILREAVVAGEVERGIVPMLTGQGERAARMVTSALVDKDMLTAKSRRAPLRLAFPPSAVERWFPLLYPMDVKEG
jgi:hypothetical protein